MNTVGGRPDCLSVEVIINPVCIRFSFFEGDVFYHFAGYPDSQLDKMDRLMGVDPSVCGDFTDSNLGFIPVASTVLIRGEKTVLVDPGNQHLGFYGQLKKALEAAGCVCSDIDTVVVTHWHHDHFSNVSMFPGAELVVGEGELEFGAGIYGAGEVRGKTDIMGSISVVSDLYTVCPGVEVMLTPGHSPGSVTVIAEHPGGKTAVTGDTIMTREQFESGQYSSWCTEEEKKRLLLSKEAILSSSPSEIIPGHDKPFFVQRKKGEE